MAQGILAHVSRHPYDSGFHSGLFPMDHFYFATISLMGFARAQLGCSSLQLMLLFLISSKGVRV